MSIPKPSLYYHLYGSLSKQYYNRRFVIVVSRTLFNSQNIYFEIIFSHQYICINLLLQLPIIDNNLVILKYMYLVLSSLSLSLFSLSLSLSLLSLSLSLSLSLFLIIELSLLNISISIFIPYPIYKIMV